MPTEEDYALMKRGICIVCKKKISKHSKWKRGYCLNQIMEKTGIATQKIKNEKTGEIETAKFFPASLNGWDNKK